MKRLALAILPFIALYYFLSKQSQDDNWNSPRHIDLVENLDSLNVLCDPQLKASCCRKLYSAESQEQEPSFSIIGELNVLFSPRFQVVREAITLTRESNPGVQYVFVTSQWASVESLRIVTNSSQDVWFCAEVLYGTLFDIASLYSGVKVVSQLDLWYPSMSVTCSFRHGNRSAAYFLSRDDIYDPTPNALTCNLLMDSSIWDAVICETAPNDLRNLKVAGHYEGCENLAGFILQRNGYELNHLCPLYAPKLKHSRLPFKIEMFSVRVRHTENDAGVIPSVDGASGLCSKT